MKRLLALRLHKFGSISGTQTLTFPEGPGLFFVTGRNLVDPRLGTNGVGKTTLWNALTWLFFEKTLRGLRAADISPWTDPGGTWVELDYTDDEQTLSTLRRSWKPNTWTLRCESATLDETIDLTKHPDNPALVDLRLSFEMWTNCVANPQREPMFLDLRPEAKATLLAEALGLDIWLERAQRASKSADAADQVCRDVERRVERLRARVEEAPRSDLGTSQAAWLERREARLLELEAVHRKGVDERRGIVDQLQEAEDAVVGHREDLAAIVAGHDKILADLEAIRTDKDRRELLREMDRLGDTLVAKVAEVDALKSMHVCPTCAQGVSEEHAAHLAAKADSAAAFAGKALAKAREALAEWRAIEDETAAEADKEAKRVTRHRELVARWETDAAELRRRLQFCDRDLDRIEDEAAAVEAEPDPFAARVAADRRALDEAEAELRQVEAELAQAHEQRQLWELWGKWYKEIRLEQMDEALAHLEVEVNSSLAELGLPDWEIRFSSDKATKSGKVSKGFTVGILSPGNTELVPWEAWSGGESQRLRLAGQAGLRDLIRDRTGAEFPMEVWDEPTEGLSPSGVADLLDFLKARASREGLQVWLVDHHSLGAGSFDGSLLLTKDADGTKIEWQG